MAARDLAIGLLLGSGGGNGTALQEIVSNSKLLKTIQIDNKFKFTINLMAIWANPRPGTDYGMVNSLLYPGIGAINTTDFSSNDNKVHGRVYYYSGLVCYLIAYENDIPLCANILTQTTYTNYYNTHINTNTGKVELFPSTETIIDISESTINDNIVLWKPADTLYQHFLVNADDNYSYRFGIPYKWTRKEYIVQYDAQEDKDYAILDSTTTNTGGLWVSNARTYEVKYTDLSAPQCIAKYQEIVAAINATHNIDYVPAVFGEVRES